MTEEERWDRIARRYIRTMQMFMVGTEAIHNMDDEDLHAVLENVRLEFDRIEELLE